MTTIVMKVDDGVLLASADSQFTNGDLTYFSFAEKLIEITMGDGTPAILGVAGRLGSASVINREMIDGLVPATPDESSILSWGKRLHEHCVTSYGRSPVPQGAENDLNEDIEILI